MGVFIEHLSGWVERIDIAQNEIIINLIIIIGQLLLIEIFGFESLVLTHDSATIISRSIIIFFFANVRNIDFGAKVITTGPGFHGELSGRDTEI